MSIKSAIEWTDATWNPVRGCTKISPGCKHCYAEVFAERFRGVKGHPYETRIRPPSCSSQARRAAPLANSKDGVRELDERSLSR